MRLLGEERFEEGTTLLFDMLQCQQLNKQVPVIKAKDVAECDPCRSHFTAVF